MAEPVPTSTPAAQLNPQTRETIGSLARTFAVLRGKLTVADGNLLWDAWRASRNKLVELFTLTAQLDEEVLDLRARLSNLTNMAPPSRASTTTTVAEHRAEFEAEQLVTARNIEEQSKTIRAIRSLPAQWVASYIHRNFRVGCEVGDLGC